MATACNAFGNQEPGGPSEILAFAQHNYSFKGIILSKGEVNGPKTHATFEYLKAKTGKKSIAWYVS